MGILAHVDAGKTSLTERLLYAAGVIDHVGRVDDGSTRTDSMDLERRRGITIRSAVVSFELGDLTVNLIDTPGHSDFIAEVERALSVLDGAVLVISAVEGVQVQTRLLMRTLTRLRIPTLLFVNKIDRMGARYDELLADLDRLLTPTAVPMGSVTDLGTRAAQYRQFPLGNKALGELLAEGNDRFLARYLDEKLAPQDYHLELADQVRRPRVHPVYFGSAMTGEGVPELIEGIREWLPRATEAREDPLRASVFKVERGPAGEKIASARVFAGRLHARQAIDVHRGGMQYEVKPTSVRLFERGGTRSVESAEAGRIVALRGLKQVQIGDQLGTPAGQGGHFFAPPTLETVVHTQDRVKLFQALQQLAEQDPLIRVRKDATGQISVNLYGEVQKEVIASLLEEEYGLAVAFSETTPIHVERPAGIGTAIREIGDPRNLWCAGVGFRVSPASVGTGIDYRLEVELGGLPRAFHTAIEETTRAALQHGLSGWEVVDCRVDLIRTQYSSPVTVAGDFRKLVPLVLIQALQEAGTRVHEPVDSFELELPPDAVSSVIAKLVEAGATLESTEIRTERAVLTGLIPVGRVYAFEAQLPGLTHGEGILLTTFSGYHPVPTAAGATDEAPEKAAGDKKVEVIK
ncbi:TetM/TetW/TetO/TetS family tetracycline resistance ribosomal protection protein [Streptomyces sp. SID13031]|uniref:elongation factor G n=1 Tax=Streptomyces sp. SID13031 TaxID=2706046 RepID=UPI0013C93FBB|nr:TetM/TetW/TetO/TetS family tetracycline resistance ribosomal protection protein [Streptomyces sp. SID13031]NEA31961.1 TetM/TetW/TetO/TetS family tetracycline resistance ribosomal protection protein [Streptomyces sp. SID13031]